ncbi:DUF5683 domain-containing protein [Pedobacter immunditicola]|uniref:DUF5683 domain-containing protein n=1 Tax=Pedobacter immunditicola TaxID=3133440 RepID=UPI0030AE902E
MSKIIWVSVILFFAVFSANAQDPIDLKKDSAAAKTAKIDTLKPVYVNPGKIAGRRAAIRSAILPGMGQIGNGVTVYRIAKVAAIYTGATLLTLSYIDNDKQYKRYLTELQYRVEHNNESPPGSDLTPYTTDRLTIAKDTFARNKWVIIFSYGALYAVNIIEAYVDARLKHFDVGDDLSLKFSPSFNAGAHPMYGYHAIAPGLKITLRL